jgi:hypothetical protein
MKNTKNGVKKNPVLVLAVLGLLVGAGATGAIAAGLVPNLNSNVSGSVNATVTDSPLMTISSNDEGFTGYQTGADNEVKFSDAVTIAAPGSADLNLALTVNRLVDSASGVLISIDGLGANVKVNVTSDVGTAARIGNGQWILTDDDGTLAADDAFALTFTFYVSQYNGGASAAMDNIWDFTISEVNTSTA